MRDIEHPDITQALKTGYPNMVDHPDFHEETYAEIEQTNTFEEEVNNGK